MAQTISFLNAAIRTFSCNSAQSTDEVYTKTLGGVYLLPKHTKSLLPGYHRAKLITDLDMTKDPGALYQRELSYFLYPIDIRNIYSKKPFDTVLIFFKENVENHIPDGYQLHHIFNDKNIIAIKKD